MISLVWHLTVRSLRPRNRAVERTSKPLAMQPSTWRCAGVKWLTSDIDMPSQRSPVIGEKDGDT